MFILGLSPILFTDPVKSLLDRLDAFVYDLYERTFLPLRQYAIHVYLRFLKVGKRLLIAERIGIYSRLFS